MGLDGALADHQLPAISAFESPRATRAEDLALAWRQPSSVRGSRRTAGLAANSSMTAGDRRGEQRVAAGDDVDACEQLLRRARP